MINRKVTVQTPYGPHEIPSWARCYCVTRHVPNYPHPLPYFLPDGRILYLCPNMHLSTQTLYGLYKKLDGPPDMDIQRKFPHSVQRLVRMVWRMEQDELSSDQYLKLDIFRRLNAEMNK